MSATLTPARTEARHASSLLGGKDSRTGHRPPTPLDVARAQARALTSIALSLADLAELATAAAGIRWSAALRYRL